MEPVTSFSSILAHPSNTLGAAVLYLDPVVITVVVGYILVALLVRRYRRVKV